MLPAGNLANAYNSILSDSVTKNSPVVLLPDWINHEKNTKGEKHSFKTVIANLNKKYLSETKFKSK